MPDTARLTTFARFDDATKQSADPLVDCTTTKEEAIRPICLLPAALAPVLMETKMSPTTAWPILQAFATKHKIVQQLHPLFTWLSAVGHVVNNDSRIDVFAAADMDPVLHQQRRLVSNSILGAPQTSPTTQRADVSPAPTTPDSNLDAIKLLAATIAGALPGAKAAPTPKTPAQRWPHQIATLLRVCQVTGESLLPSVWWEGAKAKKSDFRVLLTTLVRQRAENLNLPVPFIPHRVANKIHDQEFVPTNELDPKDGLSIWDFPELTPTALAALERVTREWTDHLKGRNNPSLAETRTALRDTYVTPIHTYVNLYAHVAHFEVVADVCFGQTHHVVTELRYLRAYIVEDRMQLERIMAADRLLGSQIVTMVRLQTTGYLRTACQTAGRIILPDLASMADDLRFGIWVPPRLHPGIAAALHPSAPPTQRLAPAPTTLPRGTPTPQLRSAPPRTQSGTNSGQSYAALDTNHAFNAAWHFRPALRPIIYDARTKNGGAVPSTDDGVDFCLTFQYKGECRSNCNGRITHRQPSAAEFARLDAWNRRFCNVAPTQPTPTPPPPTHYTQPTLPRQPQPARSWTNNSRHAQERGSQRDKSPTKSSATSQPPVPAVVVSDPSNNGASTLEPK